MAMFIYDLGWLLAQAALLLLCAPLVAGIIKKIKALLQNRIGSSIFQEYFDLYKWWQKPTVLTPYTSLIFIIAASGLFCQRSGCGVDAAQLLRC